MLKKFIFLLILSSSAIIAMEPEKLDLNEKLVKNSGYRIEGKKHANLDEVKNLIKSGADVIYRSKIGNLTPLGAAILDR